MQACLEIIYRGTTGQALTAATIEDRGLLVAAAKAAVSEAFERAEAIAADDEFVGDLQREEAERLARILARLIPELRGSQPQLRVLTAAEASPHDTEGAGR